MGKKNARLTEAKPSARGCAILADLRDAIKAALMAGKPVRVIDYDDQQRAHVVAAIATLRDELPIRCGWQIIRESTLSETRLRARRYSIDGAHLSQAKGGTDGR